MSLPSLETPARPSLPPLLFAALSAWMAIYLAEELTWRMYADELEMHDLVLEVAGTALVTILIVLAWRRLAPQHARNAISRLTRSGIAIILMAFTSAFVCGFCFWTGWANDAGRLPAILEQDVTIELDLIGDPARRDYGYVSNAQMGDGPDAIRVRGSWPKDNEGLFAGHRIAVTGSVSVPKPDDSGRWNHQNGFAGTLRAMNVEELGCSAGLRGLVTSFRDESFEHIAALGGDAAGLLAGVLLGNKTIYADSELEQAFQTTGLAHLMAVSGTQLAIVTMLLSAVLARTPLRRGVRSAMLVAALVVYVAITGFAASAIRACTMCSVALVLGMTRQRAHVPSGLALCVFVFLGLSPPMAFSLGFQLSVLSVFGLVVFGAWASYWLAHALPRLPEFVSSSIAATLAASCLTLPVTVAQFAQLPLISPVANLIAAPLITAALCLGVIALVFGIVLAPVGNMLLQFTAAIASCCASCVRCLADIPGACFPLSSGTEVLGIFFCIVFACLWIAWPLPRRHLPGRESSRHGQVLRMPGICIAFSLPVVLVFALGFGQLAVQPGPTGSRVVMLNVGQGDSMLVQSGKANMLVDTGERGDVLLRELAEQGVTHLDAVVITHKDADHAGALRELAGIIGIDHVYVHSDLLDERFMEPVLESARWVTGGRGAEGVRPGSTLRAGEFALTIVAPQAGGESENDDSLVGLLEFDADGDGSIEARGLLTGDAESTAMEGVTSRVGDIDFLKVAHHGSKGGLTDEQLTRLAPEIALISVGADNKYGHPNAETLRMLNDVGTRIYRTDEQGAITIGFSADGIRVTTER